MVNLKNQITRMPFPYLFPFSILVSLSTRTRSIQPFFSTRTAPLFSPFLSTRPCSGSPVAVLSRLQAVVLTPAPVATAARAPVAVLARVSAASAARAHAAVLASAPMAASASQHAPGGRVSTRPRRSCSRALDSRAPGGRRSGKLRSCRAVPRWLHSRRPRSGDGAPAGRAPAATPRTATLRRLPPGSVLSLSLYTCLVKSSHLCTVGPTY